MQIIYLDYNCFQRPFDDPLNTRIQTEALACVEIIRRTDEAEVELVWSFVHEDESQLCPFPERRGDMLLLARICRRRQGPAESIRQRAKRFVSELRLSDKDALHLAAAIESGANFLLTCDDRFLHRANRAGLGIAIMNPVEYIRNVQP